MTIQPKVFLETSALFAGVWSDTSGARQILQLAEAGLVMPVVSPQVLSEIEDNLRRKAPDLLGKLAVLFDRVGLVWAEHAPESHYEAALALTGAPGDGQMLSTAWEVGAEVGLEFFVTLDREHFLDNEALRAAVPFPLGTAEDFLLWYRKNYIEKAR